MGDDHSEEIERAKSQYWDAAMLAVLLYLDKAMLWRAEGSDTPNLVSVAGLERQIETWRKYPPHRQTG